jgi:hypothetical protein
MENGSYIAIVEDIPFSRRCLKETEQNNTENDNQFFHVRIFRRQI